jgi:hypothetical protein
MTNSDLQQTYDPIEVARAYFATQGDAGTPGDRECPRCKSPALSAWKLPLRLRLLRRFRHEVEVQRCNVCSNTVVRRELTG